MVEFEHGSAPLGRIHRKNNDRKYYCHFTGFLEGIAASGHIERGELEPLIAESIEFVRRVSDNDALDIVEDFQADLLDFHEIADAVDIRLRLVDANCEKSQLNRFLGYCRGIVCDNSVTLREAEGVLSIIAHSPSLRSVVGVRQIETVCLDALADGILSDEESQDICESIGQIVGDSYGDTGLAQVSGVANFDEFHIRDLRAEFDGARIVLTGNFSVSPRRLFEDEVREYGAQIDRSVSRNTDYLIVGGEASRDWIEMNRGTKIRKAQQMRLAGGRPNFISEMQLVRLMREE